MVVEALSWWSRRASQHPAVQSPVHPWKSPTNLARSPLHVALVGRKMTMVRDQLFSQKSPGSRFRFSRTGVQPSPGSSTIELPSAFAESCANPPDWELPGSSRQCSLPLACRHPPEGHQIGARKRRTPENTILSQPYCRRVSIDRPNREGSQLAASLEGEPGPTPAGKTLPHSYPETRFRRERARDWHYLIGSMANLLCHRSFFSCKYLLRRVACDVWLSGALFFWGGLFSFPIIACVLTFLGPFIYFRYIYPFWVVSLWPRKAFTSVGPVRMLESTE